MASAGRSSGWPSASSTGRRADADRALVVRRRADPDAGRAAAPGRRDPRRRRPGRGLRGAEAVHAVHLDVERHRQPGHLAADPLDPGRPPRRDDARRPTRATRRLLVAGGAGRGGARRAGPPGWDRPRRAGRRRTRSATGPTLSPTRDHSYVQVPDQRDYKPERSRGGPAATGGPPGEAGPDGLVPMPAGRWGAATTPGATCAARPIADMPGRPKRWRASAAWSADRFPWVGDGVSSRRRARAGQDRHGRSARPVHAAELKPQSSTVMPGASRPSSGSGAHWRRVRAA